MEPRSRPLPDDLEGHGRPIEWLASQDDLIISGDCERFQIWSAERQLLAQIGRPPRLYARDVSPCGRFLYAEKIGNERWGAALVSIFDQGRVVSQLPCASSKPSGSCFSSDASLLAVANIEKENSTNPVACESGTASNLWNPIACRLLTTRWPSTTPIWRLPARVSKSASGNAACLLPGHDAAILALESDRQHLNQWQHRRDGHDLELRIG